MDGIKLNDREKLMLQVGIVLILSAAFYAYLYQPQINKLVSLKSNIDLKLKELKKKKLILERKSNLGDKYRTLLQRYKKEKQKFLTSKEKDRLIIDINDLVTKTKVEVLTIKSQPVIKKSRYLQFPILIELLGNYKDIIDFIDQLETLSYLIRINELNISSYLTSSNKIKVKINLSSYALVGESSEKN